MMGSGNIILSSISDERKVVKLEINHAKEIEGKPVLYELVDGTKIEVLSLSAEQLICEKILAYKNRRFVRDLYDIYHLMAGDVDISSILPELQNFIREVEKPVDEAVLKTIVYVGLPPSFERMVHEIRRMVS